MPPFVKRLTPALSGTLFFLAFLGPQAWWIVFVAIAPFLAFLRSRRGWAAFRAGYSFGLVFMLFQFSWLIPLVDRWVGNAWLAALPMGVGSVLAAGWFGLLGWLISRAWEKQMAWLIPFIWSGVELIRSLCPTLAYPWGLAGTPLSARPELMQLAWFGSVFLVSFWVLIPNLLLALTLTRVRRFEIRAASLTFGLLLLVSLARYFLPLSGDPIQASAGQPGVDLAFLKQESAKDLHNFNVGTIIRDAVNRKSDLLVLPEGSNLNGDTPTAPSFPLDTNLATVYGSHRQEGEKTYQSAFLAEHGSTRYADKVRLVIFGEFVPGRKMLPFLSAFHLPNADVDAGTKLSLLKTTNTKGLQIGPLVCFEAIFPDLAYRQALQGANVLAVLSIDNWFQGSFALDQLLSASAFRAVEAGLPAVRAAEIGPSAIFDARGRMVAKCPMNQLATAHAQILVGRGGPFPLFALFPLASLMACFYAGAPRSLFPSGGAAPQNAVSVPSED